MQPLVSLVIPTHNRERFLPEAIASVLQQSFSRFELLIWLDGCTDGSQQIASDFAQQDDRVRVFAAPQAGQATALNQAIAQSRGAYIGWLDDDDWLAPTALAETVAVLEQHPPVGWVYTDYLDTDAAGQVTGYGSRCRLPYSQDGLLVNFMTFHFRLVRRSLFEQLGGLDRSLPCASDYDFCLRLSEIAPVQRVQRPLYYYRHHGGMISQQQRPAQIQESSRAIRKALQRRGLAERLELVVHLNAADGTGRFVLQRKRPERGWRTAGRSLTHWGIWLTAVPFSLSSLPPVQAQSRITPANDGTGSRVTRSGNRLDIDGGTLSGDRKNLFHTFSRFGLSSGEIANFLANPALKNILGRVNGGEASIINGLIQVSGGNPNLFLMNPAGIVFGANARLNVPAAFAATTATSIGFGNQWFDAVGANRYRTLVGNPTQFRFAAPLPGAIVNLGNLAVNSGQTLSLIGGTVLSLGTLAAPAGQIVVAAVPGERLVRLSQTGSLLSLELLPIANNSPPSLTPATLPQLLTGGNLDNATGLTLLPNGTVHLSGSGVAVTAGDAGVRSTTAQTATLFGNRNLTLIESQLYTTGDLNLLAGNQVYVRDSVANPVAIRAGGKLTIQGNQGIDILALNHLQVAPFQSGGDLSLISDGVISGDSHFRSGGNFAIGTRSGSRGNFISLYDPIISANGDVTFGNYSGAALKIEATGSISGGEITITSPDIGLIGNPDPDAGILASEPALILRAGVTSLANPANVPTTTGGTTFAGSGSATTPATIAIGDVTTSDTSTFGTLRSGRVLLSAPGDINTGDINTSADVVFVGAGYDAIGGAVEILSGGSITTGAIDTSAIGDSATGSATGGNVTLRTASTPGSNLRFSSIDTSSEANLSQAGSVSLLARGQVQGTDSGVTINTSAATTDGSAIPGAITIQHDGGAANLDFVIGSATPNGTAGTINGGAFTVSDATYPLLPNSGPVSGTPVGLTINSINTPPTLAVIPPLSGAEQNKPFSISYSQIIGATAVADGDADQTRVFVSAIAPGAILKINGKVVSLGSEIPPDAEIEFTPPDGFVGQLDQAFTVFASDRVSASPLRNVTITVAAPPPPPPTPPPPDVPDLQDLPSCAVVDCRNGDFAAAGETQSQFQSQSQSPPQSLSLEQALDDRFTKMFGDFGGNLFLDNPRTVAQRIEQATGARPAFLYVSFVPADLAAVRQPGAAITPQASDQLELVMVTAQGNPIRKRLTAATRDRVLAVARTFRLETSDPRKTRSTSYLESAQLLYQWLIAPIQGDLQARQINNLVFLMDAGLRGLPIAALHDGKGFLVETYSIGLMPSLSLTDTRYQDIRNTQVFGLGISESTQGQSPLPAVKVEVNAVTQLWAGQNAFNENVTLEKLQTLRQQQPYGMIHLATHASFEAGAIENSYIQLWDRKLRPVQIRELGWNNPPLELLVLSACATAVGDHNAELGFAGLAVQTGVKTAVASLWYVSDAATAALMSEFYRDLRLSPQGSIKAEALRQAQLSLLTGKVSLDGNVLRGRNLGTGLALPLSSLNLPDRQFAHPYYWAAFTMIGSPW